MLNGPALETLQKFAATQRQERLSMIAKIHSATRSCLACGCPCHHGQCPTPGHVCLGVG